MECHRLAGGKQGNLTGRRLVTNVSCVCRAGLPPASIHKKDGKPNPLHKIELMVESIDIDPLAAREATVGDAMIGRCGAMQVVYKAIGRVVLKSTNGNQVEASKLLGITRTTLRTKIRKLRIAIERVVHMETDEAD